MVQTAVSAKYIFDLQPGDVFWCTADPGWVTGVSTFFSLLQPYKVADASATSFPTSDDSDSHVSQGEPASEPVPSRKLHPLLD